jgi:hypothetical protein
MARPRVGAASLAPSRLDALWGLTKLWFVWSSILFTTLLVQSVNDFYGGKTADAWGWFVPLVSPTLSAMIGVFVAAKSRSLKPRGDMSPYLYSLSYWLSVTYLTIISFTIYIAPVAWSRAGITPVDLFKLSQLWLLPIQALVVAALGALLAAGSERS